MSELSLLNDNGKSPFDSIRRFDEKGIEFWSARELMRLMGYQKWQQFENPIKQAIENLELNDDNVSDHITAAGNVVKRSQGGGSIQLDYRLTRYACYMVALCCDGRKAEVASAKKYFAVKTRQAETVIPAQVDTIRELELKLAIAEAEKQKTLAEKTILDTRHLIVTTCPEPIQQKILGYKEVVTVEYRDRQFQRERLINDGTTVTKTELCDRYGLKTRNGKPDYRKLNALLKETGISGLSDAWQLAASIQESQQFRREYLPTLDRLVDDSDRQMWLGE
jgi:hypothetical protein